jgi:uncharacterized protein YehS (DUF1456 family)
MINNDILRRIRYTFELDDSSVMAIFRLGGEDVTRAQMSDWLKKDDDPDYRSLNDKFMAVFLNGFIVHKRGPKDDGLPVPDEELNNNVILRKLKIALNLQTEGVIELLSLADLKVSKPELSALFRKPGHKHYRKCKDQFLRNFLHGMQLKFHVEDV